MIPEPEKFHYQPGNLWVWVSPLANYDNLLQAIEMLNSPDGFGLGARNMTVSTAGLVPQIKPLSKEKLQINLAVSLHASKDNLTQLAGADK